MPLSISLFCALPSSHNPLSQYDTLSHHPISRSLSLISHSLLYYFSLPPVPLYIFPTQTGNRNWMVIHAGVALQGISLLLLLQLRVTHNEYSTSEDGVRNFVDVLLINWRFNFDFYRLWICGGGESRTDYGNLQIIYLVVIKKTGQVVNYGQKR